MKQHETKVIFLLEDTEAGEPDVIAFFPEMYYNKEMYKTTFTSYSHIGQHAGCHIDYANSLKMANKEQYNDLLKELIGQGYDNLKILNKS